MLVQQIFSESKSKTTISFRADNGVVNAFSLSDDQFREIYNRTKPTKTTAIIFSSQKGVRAGRAAADVGAALGYEKYELKRLNLYAKFEK